MKKYNSPEMEIENLKSEDVISCSFGALEELPSSGNTPNLNLDQNQWAW